MPVSMGVLCARCKTVYFVSRSRPSAHIRYERAGREFKLTCVSPCCAVVVFHEAMLKPYSASAEAIERGYAYVTACHSIVEGNARKRSAQKA